MTKPLGLSSAAAREFREAARWYRAHRPDLRATIIEEINAALGRIEANAGLGAIVPGDDVVPVRRLVLRRVPYNVVYVELPDCIQVVAIAHRSRRPDYWRDRFWREAPPTYGHAVGTPPLATSFRPSPPATAL